MRTVTLRVWDPEADLELVAAMGLRFIRETPTGKIMGGEPTLERVRFGIQTISDGVPGVVILAHDTAGTPVGFAALVVMHDPFTGGVWVDETGIWVEPEARRDTHAGPLLLAASENWARQVGAAVLKMTAPPRSGFGRWLRHQGYKLAEEALYKQLKE